MSTRDSDAFDGADDLAREFSPEDARNAARAALNLVPATMDATRAAMGFFVEVTTGRKGSLDNQTLKLMALLIDCVLRLENRLEQADGRAGLPREHLEQLFREFGAGSPPESSGDGGG